MGPDSRIPVTVGSGRTRLDSLKDIAKYLNTSVRTVQRWEKLEGLPVCRHEHARQDTVYAFSDDIDRWRQGRNRKSGTGNSGWQAELEAARLAVRTALPRMSVAGPRQDTVGRDAECEHLHEHLRAVREAGTRLLCVTGEPGIGKTTLLERFAAEIQSGGEPCRVAFATCSQQLGGTDAYQPVVDILDRLTRGTENAAIAQLLRLVAPTWYVHLAPLWAIADSAVLESARAASRERMHRELTDFFTEVAAGAALVLVIDDLHWADASSVDSIAHLCTRGAAARVLLVAAYRPAEMSLTGHPFISARQELARRGVCHELAIPQLDRPAIERYLALAFPGNAFPAELTACLFARTEGNPFFVVELVSELRRRESIRHDGANWILAVPVSTLASSFPASVHSMIHRKIDQLSDDDRRLLTAAAVQGVEFDPGVIANALGMDAALVEEHLRELDRLHSFVRILRLPEDRAAIPSENHTFVHVLYQNAFYSLLTPARKVGFSLAVAEAIRKSSASDPARHAGRLAVLYEAGRDYFRATEQYLQAAQNAALIYANREAVELSRRAIVNAERLPDQQRFRWVLSAALQLAELHLRLSDFDEAVADFGTAERAAGEAGLVAERIDAICGAALALLNLKRTDEMRALGRRALELAGHADSDSLIASAEMVVATERMCAGDLASAEALVERSAPVIRNRRGNSTPLHIIESIGYEAALHGWRLEYEQALPACDWALERARSQGAVFHIICLLFIRGLGLGNFGRLGDSMDSLAEAMRLAELNHDRYWLPRLPNTLGWLYREAFDSESALRLNEQGIGMAREFGFTEGEANSRINLAHDCIAAGEVAQAEHHLHAAEGLLEADAWFRWVYRTRLESEFAHYWLARGDLKRAGSAAQSALDLAHRLRRRKYIAWSRKLLGDIAVAEERYPDAEVQYVAGLQALTAHPCPAVEWQIFDALARVHARLHRSDGANENRARARDVLSRLANSLRDGRLREVFLASRPARELNVSQVPNSAPP